MAIFYSKKLFILLLTIFSLQRAEAQTTPNKMNNRSSKKTISKASNNSKVKLRLDSQNRAYFIDPQGDKIIILDYKCFYNY